MKDKKAELIKKYPYIVAWGQAMGSFGYYIEDQVKEATRDNAPKDAIYKQTDGTWAIAGDHKEDLDQYLNGTKGGIIINWY